MTLLIRNQTCLPSSKVEHKHDPNMQATFIFIVSLSPIALTLSSFALIVLTRRRAVRLGPMRVNLTTLTAFETLLNMMIFMLTVSRLTGLSGEGQHSTVVAFTFVCFFFINGALCARNWIITLIALARCIAITRPMTTRLMSTHLFRPRALAICTITCIALGFFLSLLRLFEQNIVICENLDHIIRLIPNTSWRLMSEIFFIYQSAMPISIVFITTLIMIVVLLRKKTFKLDDSKPANPSVMVSECIATGSSGGSRIGGGTLGSDAVSGMKDSATGMDNQSILSTRTTSMGNRATTKRIPCSASQLRYSFGVRQTQICAKTQINYRRTQNQLRATRMITLLAAAFILFEAPIFFCVALKSYIPYDHFHLVTTGLKALVVLDSCANVIIYLFMSKRFRQESSRLWTGINVPPTRLATTQSEAAL